MEHFYYYEYLKLNCEDLFTVIMLPKKDGQFPVVIRRSPYVAHTVDMTEEEIAQRYFNSHKAWLDSGYAVISQHCRGQGKSTGAFVPYIYEREDGLALREWIRSQAFYNGELFEGYVFIKNLFNKATNRIIIIDSYLDYSVLEMLLGIGIPITIYIGDSAHITNKELDLLIISKEQGWKNPDIDDRINKLKELNCKLKIG